MLLLKSEILSFDTLINGIFPNLIQKSGNKTQYNLKQSKKKVKRARIVYPNTHIAYRNIF